MVTDKSVQQQLSQLYQQWMEAVKHKDVATCERILADEYTYTASGQGQWNRQGWLDMLPRYELTWFEFPQIDVRSYGDVAVGIVHYREEGRVAGAVRRGDFLITDVWVKRDGRWQVVARSSILQSPA